MEAFAGLLLAWTLFRVLLPKVFRYEIRAGELRLVVGKLAIWRVSLGDFEAARRPKLLELLLAPRALNRLGLGTVYLVRREASFFRPGILVSPSDPEDFLGALEREGVRRALR